jgi:hypothetical protein
MTDFNALISDMKQQGAFTTYAEPFKLSEDEQAGINKNFEPLNQPGAFAYARGAARLKNNERNDIPPSLIRAQKQTIMHGIKLFMPHEAVLAHVRDFLSNPEWIQNPTFQDTFRELELPTYLINDVGSGGYLPDKHSFDLDTLARRENPTKFTRQEYGAILGVLEKFPELHVAVLGYQSAHIDYLHRLRSAIDDSAILDEKEKTYGYRAISNFLPPWESPNFIVNVLPAICLQVAARLQHDANAEPTRDDFAKGMQFLFSNNSFSGAVPNVNGDIRHFKCPAQHFIARSTAQELTGRDPSFSSVMGMGIFCIYRQLKGALDPELASAVREQVRDIQDHHKKTAALAVCSIDELFGFNKDPAPETHIPEADKAVISVRPSLLNRVRNSMPFRIFAKA